MPRGRKNLTIDEQILKQKEKIASLKVELKVAQENLDKLEQKKEESDLKKIRAMLIAKGISANDAFGVLSEFIEKDFPEAESLIESK